MVSVALPCFEFSSVNTLTSPMCFDALVMLCSPTVVNCGFRPAISTSVAEATYWSEAIL